jgi:shikimate kinase
VWLVGLSGSGKSTVGPLVARRLRYAFIDLDRLIELRAGETISDIFGSEGESGFRAREGVATAELARRTGLVVATGGGWMSRADVTLGWRGCVRVWLRVAPVTAATRLDGSGETRPLVHGPAALERLSALLDARKSGYARAEIAVDTDGRAPHDVAQAVVERLVRLSGTQAGSPGEGVRWPNERLEMEGFETQ